MTSPQIHCELVWKTSSWWVRAGGWVVALRIRALDRLAGKVERFAKLETRPVNALQAVKPWALWLSFLHGRNDLHLYWPQIICKWICNLPDQHKIARQNKAHSPREWNGLWVVLLEPLWCERCHPLLGFHFRMFKMCIRIREGPLISLKLPGCLGLGVHGASWGTRRAVTCTRFPGSRALVLPAPPLAHPILSSSLVLFLNWLYSVSGPHSLPAPEQAGTQEWSSRPISETDGFAGCSRNKKKMASGLSNPLSWNSLDSGTTLQASPTGAWVRVVRCPVKSAEVGSGVTVEASCLSHSWGSSVHAGFLS